MGSIILFLIVLSVLVLVHEAGHFFTALWIGAKVEEFGVGFPPRAWSKIKNGIRYSINWIPLGGFVKIKGESGADRTDPDSFGSKPAWKRFIVLIAGVTMNLLLAAVLLSVGYGIGLPQVLDDLPASAHVREQQIYVADVAPESPASEVGLQSGDVLESIDNVAFVSAEEAQNYIQAHVDAEMTLRVKREQDVFTYLATPRELEIAGNKKVLGVGLVTTGVVSYPWYTAPVMGVEATVVYTREILRAFGDLLLNLVVHQRVSADLSGPVGIAAMTGQVAKMGFTYLLQFAALLSINLAVINVLPLPALDGGRILFVAIEKIIRRPVSTRIEGTVHAAGFALLMILVVVITFKDITKLFQ